MALEFSYSTVFPMREELHQFTENCSMTSLVSGGRV